VEPIGRVKRILKRKFIAGIVLAALLFVAAAVCFPGLSYAADKTPEADRTMSDLMLGTILALLEIEYGVELGLTTAMMETYNTQYNRDHKQLANNDRVTPSMNQYKTIDQNAPGYRSSWTENYAETYRKRENAFRETMRGSAKTNVDEADRIKGTVQKWIKDMNNASRNSDGHLQSIQAGTQEANFLNMELAGMHADMLRQIDIQMRAAVEEAQDDFDVTYAFEEAVIKWQNLAPSSGGY
jgi:hypothetical protein